MTKPLSHQVHQNYMLAVKMNQPMSTANAGSDKLNGLWKLAREGDEAAFEEVYRATAGLIYGLCLRMSADPARAEECTQRTFVQAWQHASGFRGDSKLTTWLHRIAVNEVLSHSRHETRYQLAVDDFGAIADMYQTHGSHSDLDLELAIAQLSQRAREVFVLHAVYGYQHNEAAQMLDIAIGTSKAHYHRARKMLQAALGEHHVSLN